MAAYMFLCRRESLATPTIHGAILQRLYKNLKVLSAATKEQFMCKRAGINPSLPAGIIAAGWQNRALN